MRARHICACVMCMLMNSVCGCTFFIDPSSTGSVLEMSSSAPVAALSQASLLAKAVEYLQTGNESAARDLLEMLSLIHI